MRSHEPLGVGSCKLQRRSRMQLICFMFYALSFKISFADCHNFYTNNLKSAIAQLKCREFRTSKFKNNHVKKLIIKIMNNIFNFNFNWLRNNHIVFLSLNTFRHQKCISFYWNISLHIIWILSQVILMYDVISSFFSIMDSWNCS